MVQKSLGSGILRKIRRGTSQERNQSHHSHSTKSGGFQSTTNTLSATSSHRSAFYSNSIKSSSSSGATTPAIISNEADMCPCDDCLSYMPPTPLRTEESLTGNETLQDNHNHQSEQDYFNFKDQANNVRVSEVLPTFDLDRYIINRTLNDAAARTELPDYNEVSQESRITRGRTGQPGQSSSSGDLVHPSHMERVGSSLTANSSSTTDGAAGSGQGSAPGGVTSGTGSVSGSNNNSSPNVSGPNYNDRVLNNLSQLERVDTAIHISVTLTRAYPEMGKAPLKENQLREYHPGDVITGSILVESKSARSIPFNMFLVTFEGVMTIPGSKGTVVRRTFLKMVDFGACYHYGYVPTPNVKTPHQPNIVDPVDGAEYGFPDSMTIEPGSKHKKFFYFQLPHNLLDSSCDHQIISHFDSLPPSFGLDTNCMNGAAEDIAINELLGYGRCLAPGSPIVLNDQTEKDQSISYSINVAIIGKNTGENAMFWEKKKIGSKYCMLQEKQHFIRFVPGEDINAPPPITSSAFLHPSTRKQLEKLERLSKDTIKRLEQTKELKKIGVTDERELLELTTDAVDLKDYHTVNGSDDKKETQLRLNTKPSIKYNYNYHEAISNKIDCEVRIPLRHKKKAFGFGGSSKMPDELGLLTVGCSIAKDAKIPYILPTAMKKLAEKPPGPSRSASRVRQPTLSDDQLRCVINFSVGHD
ncbi:unnamed protein product [Ambrosiozyma monospora]|uniref:Unnamed protein product n=1 Tax=Ambrosiozyma monospora TaxID=43982 RepID=A0A9W6YXS0_AMBMO|nr:unnamed protein product [Ambrosiozyma monospora]